MIALDSEPRGRRYVKNMIYNRNRLATGSYALALGRDTKIRFSLLESGRTKPWSSGLVSRAECQSIGTIGKKHRNQWQEIDGLLFSPQNSQLVHILSFYSKAMVSLFIFPTGPTALDFEPRGRRYVKNTGHNMNHLYSNFPTSMEMHYVQWFLLKGVYEITDCANK